MTRATDIFSSLSDEKITEIREKIILSVKNLLTVLDEEYERPDLLTGPEANFGLNGLEKIISKVCEISPP